MKKRKVPEQASIFALLVREDDAQGLQAALTRGVLDIPSLRSFRGSRLLDAARAKAWGCVQTLSGYPDWTQKEREEARRIAADAGVSIDMADKREDGAKSPADRLAEALAKRSQEEAAAALAAGADPFGSGKASALEEPLRHAERVGGTDAGCAAEMAKAIRAARAGEKAERSALFRAAAAAASRGNSEALGAIWSAGRALFGEQERQALEGIALGAFREEKGDGFGACCSIILRDQPQKLAELIETSMKRLYERKRGIRGPERRFLIEAIPAGPEGAAARSLANAAAARRGDEWAGLAKSLEVRAKKEREAWRGALDRALPGDALEMELARSIAEHVAGIERKYPQAWLRWERVARSAVAAKSYPEESKVAAALGAGKDESRAIAHVAAVRSTRSSYAFGSDLAELIGEVDAPAEAMLEKIPPGSYLFVLAPSDRGSARACSVVKSGSEATVFYGKDGQSWTSGGLGLPPREALEALALCCCAAPDAKARREAALRECAEILAARERGWETQYQRERIHWLGAGIGIPSAGGGDGAGGDARSGWVVHPHWRRGHEHGYWVGKKGSAKLVKKFVLPVLVRGSADPESALGQVRAKAQALGAGAALDFGKSEPRKRTGLP